MAETRMSRRERWIVGLVLGCSVAGALLLVLQPAETQRTVLLLAGTLLLPVVMLRAGVYAWHCFRTGRMAQALLGCLLTVLIFMGLVAEAAKLVAVLNT